ncbi:hypothetical protein, partial [Enterobacter ludwigii]
MRWDGWICGGGSRECSGKTKPDFYVGPAGPGATMPSTAYRYVRYLNDDGSLDKWVPGLLETKKAPVTYFGFENFIWVKRLVMRFRYKVLIKLIRLYQRMFLGVMQELEGYLIHCNLMKMVLLK